MTALFIVQRKKAFALKPHSICLAHLLCPLCVCQRRQITLQCALILLCIASLFVAHFFAISSLLHRYCLGVIMGDNCDSAVAKKGENLRKVFCHLRIMASRL